MSQHCVMKAVCLLGGHSTCSMHKKESDSSPHSVLEFASGESGLEIGPSFSHTHQKIAKLEHC